MPMNRNFEIVDGIYLVQESHELDLHHTVDFNGLDYSVEERSRQVSSPFH